MQAFGKAGEQAGTKGIALTSSPASQPRSDKQAPHGDQAPLCLSGISASQASSSSTASCGSNSTVASGGLLSPVKDYLTKAVVSFTGRGFVEVLETPETCIRRPGTRAATWETR